MNTRTMVLAATACVALAGGMASAQTISAPAPGLSQMAGQRGSDSNLRVVRRRLESLIDHLQHDRHDYNGHREKAIDDLQAARKEITAALEADEGH